MVQYTRNTKAPVQPDTPLQQPFGHQQRRRSLVVWLLLIGFLTVVCILLVTYFMLIRPYKIIIEIDAANSTDNNNPSPTRVRRDDHKFEVAQPRGPRSVRVQVFMDGKELEQKVYCGPGNLVNCLYNICPSCGCTGCDIGTIQSPMFPNPYPSGKLKYVISGPVGTNISLNFDVLHLASDINGKCIDTLDIYQNGNGVGNPYKSICEAPSGQLTLNSDKITLILNVKSSGNLTNTIGFSTNFWAADLFCALDGALGFPLCQNGGTCVDDLVFFYCKCPSSFVGGRCGLANACILNPCQPDPNALCFNVPGQAKCLCKPGYSGSFPNCLPITAL